MTPKLNETEVLQLLAIITLVLSKNHKKDVLLN